MTTGTNKPEPINLSATQKKRYFRLWIIAGLSLSVIPEFLSGASLIFSLVFMPAETSLVGLLELYLFHVYVFAVFSLPSVIFFLWTYWDRYSPDFPKRSLGLWFYLCALSPWQIYINFVNFEHRYPLFTFGDEKYQSSVLLTRAGGLLEGSVLIALGLWMAWRRFRFSTSEKIWFHWLLIVVFFSGLNFLFWSFDLLFWSVQDQKNWK